MIMTFVFHVQAAYADLCPEGFKSLCDLKAEKAGGAVSAIVSILIILAIVLALIYLVYGGIKYITSGGDKGKIDAARSHITAAIIGLLIALATFFIVGLLLGLFGLSINNLKIPTLV